MTRHDRSYASRAPRGLGHPDPSRLTDRDWRWLRHISRHGPQSSELLIELTRDTHRCVDSAKRRLQHLRETGWLFLPEQQRHISKADFNHFVYDLSRDAMVHLQTRGWNETAYRPTGHWWHGFWTASVTSAIEIDCNKRGHSFISAHRMLAGKGLSTKLPTSLGTVVPDQVFAIRHEDGYRAYALEMDCGTEPIRSAAARKSLERSVEQYREILGLKTHREAWSIRSNLILLIGCCSAFRMQDYRRLACAVGEQDGRTIRVVAFDCSFPGQSQLSVVADRLFGCWMPPRTEPAAVEIVTEN